MNPKSFENNDSEYLALISERDPKKPYIVIARKWVTPKRVYKGGKGRQQIEFHDGQRMRVLENWPGASQFELYKRVP